MGRSHSDAHRPEAIPGSHTLAWDAANPGGYARRLPSSLAVLREQGGVAIGEATLGKPLLLALPGIMIIVFIIEPAAWVALPVWLGISFGLPSSSRRLQGSGGGWELPVRRRTTNAIRHIAYLGWVVLVAMIITPLLFVLAGEPLNGAIVPAVLMVSGWAMVIFCVMAIAGQFVRRERLYVVFLALLLVMPLMFVPSRALTAILPDFLDPVIDGRYGMDTLSGRMLMRGEITAPAWDPGSWFVSAGVWLTSALSMLYLVGSTHQE